MLYNSTGKSGRRKGIGEGGRGGGWGGGKGASNTHAHHYRGGRVVNRKIEGVVVSGLCPAKQQQQQNKLTATDAT